MEEMILIANQPTTQAICRLCQQIQENSVGIFSDIGILYDCESKINKYLYLEVSKSYDDLSQQICLSCLMHIETFHKFYEKVHENQRRVLKEKYEYCVLHQANETTQVESKLDEELRNEIQAQSEGIVDNESFADAIDSEQYFIEISTGIKPETESEPNYVLKLVPDTDVENLTTINYTIKTEEISAKVQEVHESPECDDQTLEKPKRGNSRIREKDDVDDEPPDDEEGESDDDFPARDSGNEDWPAAETLNKFPRRIIENGLLTVKGKKLMAMICKFYKLECDLCTDEKSRFRKLPQLFEHYTENHNDSGYVVCCQTKFYRHPAIIMHMARHIQPDAFRCDICGYMVTRPRFLDKHRQTHLPNDQKPLACDQCPRRFCWKGALQIHQISHQPAEERKRFVCHVCGKVYETPGGLSTHKKQSHSGGQKPESHICHVCAKVFSKRTGLNEHMATIHQPREKAQVQCGECGKWLMNSRCLKSHMILHSNIEHHCNSCDYKTKKQMLLQRHFLTHHNGETKPHHCTLCGKSFKLKRALTVHLAQHNNTSKSYKCQFCDRVFASSTNFYTHRKNMHPIELGAMREKEMEEKRQLRIRAGIESSDLSYSIPDADDSKMVDEDMQDDELMHHFIPDVDDEMVNASEIISN